jgi:hypothetical protein
MLALGTDKALKKLIVFERRMDFIMRLALLTVNFYGIGGTDSAVESYSSLLRC